MSSTFARSLNKAPAYLSPCRRPTLGRTLSNSSDFSVSSSRSDDRSDIATSNPSTPALETLELHRCPNNRTTRAPSPGYAASPQPSSSRPIAIEIPKIKKNSAASIYTPPEPVSGRGELPGGYFPLHEDPTTRVHHPHPFRPDVNPFKTKAHSTMPSEYSTASYRPTSPNMRPKQATVSSYMPAGFHDQPLPLGKYYPSNYEQRDDSFQTQHKHKSNPRASLVRQDSSTYPPRDVDSRQRMLQYQRDMVAQAAMVLNHTMKNKSSFQDSAFHHVSIPDIRLGSGSAYKPLSPRLDPLGSPGPVTPMELEAGGSYLDKRIVTTEFGKENLAPNTATFSPRSL